MSKKLTKDQLEKMHNLKRDILLANIQYNVKLNYGLMLFFGTIIISIISHYRELKEIMNISPLIVIIIIFVTGLFVLMILEYNFLRIMIGEMNHLLGEIKDKKCSIKKYNIIDYLLGRVG